MCGRFVASSDPTQLAQVFDVDEVRAAGEHHANYNVAPTMQVYAVTEVPAGEDEASVRRVLDTYRWGLVPHWAKDLSVGQRMFNARAETLATKNAYRSALQSKRCIIPADGFYEWAPAPAGSKRKQPWYVQSTDGLPLAFAGLWALWRGAPNGVPVLSCTIVTTGANALMAPVHDRMPAILAPSQWGAWLDPGLHEAAALESLLAPAPEGYLDRHRVGPAVGQVRNNGPELVAPVS